MENEFWINLPSKDLKKAREFFTQIGFVLNERHASPDMLSFFVGNKKTIVNFFLEPSFKGFAGNAITDTKQSTEVLFSIGAASPAEVDSVAQKAVAAGGTMYAGPGYKDGWMYGCGFADPDGHRWNLLYMDMSKLPQK